MTLINWVKIANNIGKAINEKPLIYSHTFLQYIASIVVAMHAWWSKFDMMILQLKTQKKKKSLDIWTSMRFDFLNFKIS